MIYQELGENSFIGLESATRTATRQDPVAEPGVLIIDHSSGMVITALSRVNVAQPYGTHVIFRLRIGLKGNYQVVSTGRQVLILVEYIWVP
jgi:hypothetical protein